MASRPTLFCSLAAALGILSLTVPAHADSLSQTVALPAINDGFSFGEGDANTHFTQAMVGGLSLFDPTLGTLTAVSMEINADSFSSSLAIEAGEDIEAPFQADFAADFFELEVVYNTIDNGSQVGYVLTSHSVPGVLGCAGSGGDGTCSDYAEDNGPWVDSSDFFGQANLDDFIGLGSLDVFEIYWVAYQYLVTGQNVAFIDGSASIQLDGGNVGLNTNTFTLTYEYTPIPLPAAWLMAGPAIGLVVRRRRV